MATPRRTPYERAVARAGRAYAALMTDSSTVEDSPLRERAERHLQVVGHWSSPVTDCTCEGCMAWWPEAASTTSRRARN